MNLVRRLISDAHMRSFIVVEVDKTTNTLPCLLYIHIRGLPIEFLRLDNAIDALSNAIIRGLVVFCHAYADTKTLQRLYIHITAVLYTSVRVMDQFAQIARPSCFTAIMSASSVYLASNVSERHQPTTLCE